MTHVYIYNHCNTRAMSTSDSDSGGDSDGEPRADTAEDATASEVTSSATHVKHGELRYGPAFPRVKPVREPTTCTVAFRTSTIFAVLHNIGFVLAMHVLAAVAMALVDRSRIYIIAIMFGSFIIVVSALTSVPVTVLAAVSAHSPHRPRLSMMYALVFAMTIPPAYTAVMVCVLPISLVVVMALPFVSTIGVAVTTCEYIHNRRRL